MTVTIYDVARAAGVGIGTVSRVLNNKVAVKETTRQRVLETISRLNYTPSPIARSMSAGRTGFIGVMIPFFTRPFANEVLRGIEAATGRSSYDLVLYNVETDEQREQYFTRISMRRKVDGLVVVSLRPDDEVAANLATSLPIVLVDAYSSALTSVVVNNVQGAYEAAKHLLDLGHRRIGFINGEIEGNFKFNQANDRLIGLHRALGEAGLEFEPELMQTGQWNRKSGQTIARQLLTLKNPPSAIFAASDIQAIGAIEAARSLGLRVPENLSVIGFDDIEFSEWFELTTIRQPMRQMGELGVQKLLELLEDPTRSPELVRLETRLIERKTTAPYQAN